VFIRKTTRRRPGDAAEDVDAPRTPTRTTKRSQKRTTRRTRTTKKTRKRMLEKRKG